MKTNKIKFTLFVLLFATLNYANSQTDKITPTYVHLENTNILVRGLENPIQISSNLGGDYTVTSKSKAIIRKVNGTFTVNPINIKEDSLVLDVVSKSNPKVNNSVIFKLINVPTPKIRIGAVDPESNTNKEAILLQNSLVAVIDNFIIDGVKCNVNSYTFNYIDYSFGIAKIKSIKVESNSINKISEVIKGIGAGEKIEFTDIKVTTPSGVITINNVVFSLK
jgi:hypothetical protein